MSSRVEPSSSIMLGTKTLAPPLASASANAWPSPVFPPVTMAVRPLREKKSIENRLMSIATVPFALSGVSAVEPSPWMAEVWPLEIRNAVVRNADVVAQDVIMPHRCQYQI
jgi:hypothetical protein